VFAHTRCGDDAPEMAACRILGPVRVAVDNGPDQLLELEERACRPAGAQRQPELMAHDLRLQPLDEACRGRLPCPLAKQAVQFRDQRGIPQQLAVGHRPAQQFTVRAQPMDLLVGDPLGRLAGDQALQDHPALGDLHGLRGRDTAHPGPPVRDAFHEPFPDQHVDCQADPVARHPEQGRQLPFDQPLARSHVTTGDRVAKAARGQASADHTAGGSKLASLCCGHVEDPKSFVRNCQRCR
jgi:hypothetical protein